MRGKDGNSFVYGDTQGITPAYAGKRPCLWRSMRQPQDHPRLCGEKPDGYYKAKDITGSPPPMRGKGSCPVYPCCSHRITPAYAGKSAVLDRNTKIRRDHPRLCGEKVTMSDADARSMGSPPPMRGKVGLAYIIQPFLGITPAYAGKSYYHLLQLSPPKDHPRLCGEKSTFLCFSVLHIGSPPPMRGKGKSGDAGQQESGITPAYAGKSYPGGDYEHFD